MEKFKIDVEELNNQLAVKKQKLDTIRAYLKNVQTQASWIKAEIELLTQKGGSFSAEHIPILQTFLEARQTVILKVESEIAMLNDTIAELLKQRDNLTKELEEENKKANIHNYLEDYYIAEKENRQLKQQFIEKEEQLKEELIEKKDLERALSACNRQNDEFADMIKKLVNEKEELKQQLKELRTENMNIFEYSQKIEQQLHDLTKKIVEEIKANNIYLNSSKPNQKDHIYDSYLIEAKILTSILKKYGG